MNSVRSEMGEFQLQFMWINADRTHYRYANNPIMLKLQKRVWEPFIPGMGVGKYFCILTTYSDAPKSKTGSSYKVLGILCAFETLEALQEANGVYWSVTKWLDDEQKSAQIVKFGKALREFVPAGWYIDKTEILLEACGEGHQSEALRLAKEFAEETE